MPDPIRFAIIGLDHWYSAISLAQALAQHPDIDLVGIADRDEERAHEIAGQTNTARTSTDLHEFINDPEIDAIGSFVSVDQNPELVIAAARAGKHIVSVKPLARTLDEATRIAEAVNSSGVTFIPAESRARENDQNQRLATIVRSPGFGRLVSGNFVLSGGLPKSWPDANPDGGWWADPNRGPGGGWIDHSIYQIDLLRWLLNEEVVAISGQAANLVHKNLGVEDYGHAIVRFEGGSVFSLEDTWSAPAGASRVTSSLIGTAGVVNIDAVAGTLSTFGIDAETTGWNVEPIPANTSDPIRPIVDQIRGESTSLGTVEDAWNNLAVARAFYEAAASGTVVSPQRMNKG